MPKSLHTRQYALFLRELRAARKNAGLTQAALAQRLAMTQSDVSKCERGTRRLDIVELRAWSQALGLELAHLVARIDHSITGDPVLNAPQVTPAVIADSARQPEPHPAPKRPRPSKP